MNQDIYVVIEHLQGKVTDISYIMLAGARLLAQSTGGEVVGVLLGHGAQELANHLAADQVVYVDHQALAEFTSDAYVPVLASLIGTSAPRAVLFGNTSIGADMASMLSVRLGLPLVNLCQRFGADGKLISQICGGKIMVESELAETTTLVTVIPGGHKAQEGQRPTAPPVVTAAAPPLDNLRVSLNKYIEPEAGDVDIARETLLVSVGRGIQNKDNIELAQELADTWGAVVCASRPVIDQGWLPTSRLVGKSGKCVKPKVYLALGISGAPEHVEGITESECIIAINTDPLAPIFDMAKYGSTVDIFELLPALTEHIRQAKSR